MGRSGPMPKIYKSGGSLRDVQILAGHQSIQTTQRYIDGDTRLAPVGSANLTCDVGSPCLPSSAIYVFDPPRAVLQLPAQPTTATEVDAQKRIAFVG